MPVPLQPLAAALMAASAVLAAPAAAQRTTTPTSDTARRSIADTVAGLVVDAESRPLADATVGLWSGDREIARATSDVDGRFRFTGPPAAGATALIARRIGARPVTQTLSDGAPRHALRLVLPTLPAALPTVVTRETMGQCDGSAGRADEPVARALWQALAERYVLAPSGEEAATLGLARFGGVSPAQVGEIDERRLRPTWWGWGGPVMAQRLERGTYVSANPSPAALMVDEGAATPRWWYTNIARHAPDHFVSPAFGVRHRLRAVVGEDGGPRLLFCPVSRQEPWIEGALDVSADTALRRARWRYVTPKPAHDAGGEVTYVPRDPARRVALLVPATSVFWRLQGASGYYYQEALVHWERQFATDGSPVRMSDDALARATARQASEMVPER